MRPYIVDGTISYDENGKTLVKHIQLEIMAKDTPHAESIALSIMSKKLGHKFVGWYQHLPRVTPR